MSQKITLGVAAAAVILGVAASESLWAAQTQQRYAYYYGPTTPDYGARMDACVGTWGGSYTDGGGIYFFDNSVTVDWDGESTWTVQCNYYDAA